MTASTPTPTTTAGRSAQLVRAFAPNSAARRLLDEPVLPYLQGESLPEHFRLYGMYPSSESWRQDAAAFTVRDDVRVDDVLESVTHLLRMAAGMVGVLSCDSNADEMVTDTAAAVEHLLREARGLHSLLRPALCGVELSADGAMRVARRGEPG